MLTFESPWKPYLFLLDVSVNGGAKTPGGRAALGCFLYPLIPFIFLAIVGVLAWGVLGTIVVGIIKGARLALRSW